MRKTKRQEDKFVYIWSKVMTEEGTVITEVTRCQYYAINSNNSYHLSNAYYVPGIVLSGLHRLYHLIITAPYAISTIIPLIPFFR